MTSQGLFQNSAGSMFGKSASDGKGGLNAEAFDVLMERVITTLATKPIRLATPMVILSTCKGPAIIVKCEDGAKPQGMQVVRRNGEQATLGVGMESTGLIANGFALRDIYHAPEPIVEQKIGRAYSGQDDPGTCYGYEGYGTGKEADDGGQNIAAPGEIYAAPFITMYLRHVTQNFEIEGVLLTTLDAASDPLTGATTATIQTWIKDPDNPGDLKADTSDEGIKTITNRDTTMSGIAGQYVRASKINDEWRPVWQGCES